MLPQLRRGGGVLFVCLYVRTDMSIQMHTCSPDRYTNSSMAMLSISWEKKRGWRWRVRDWHCTALPLAWLHSAPGHHPSIQQQPASIPSTQLSLSPFHTPPPSPPPRNLAWPVRDRCTRLKGTLHTSTLAHAFAHSPWPPPHCISPLVCTSPSNVKRRRKRSRHLPGTGICHMHHMWPCG